jgi:two-component system sensor kinase FixL
LADKLADANCPVLPRLAAFQPPRVCAAFRDTCRAPDDGPARAWAEEVHREGLPVGLCWQEVLTGLHCLQRAVRFEVLKSTSQKTALLGALSEMAAAIERLRNAYLAVRFAQPAEDRGEASDFAALADSADLFICLINLSGKPFYLNRAGRSLVGLGEHDPVAEASLHAFYADDSWAELRDVAVPAVKAAGRWEGRSRLRNVQSGQLCEVATTIFAVKPAGGERVSCLAVIHRFARQERQLEEALAECQARKHAILESALDPIITINHDGLITEFNRAAEQTFGHSREAVLGTQPSDVLFPVETSSGQQDRITRYLEAGEGSMLGRRVEVTAARANGETFPAEMAMTMNLEHGAPVLTFFVRDISQQKKAEQQRARYEAELERSNQELEQFAYVASHDLQEPLRKIRTFGDRLEMKCAAQLDETGRECVDRMQRAAARMQTLIDGLLTLSRVTTQSHDFVRVDLAKVAQEVVSDLEVQIEQTGGRVELGKLPTIQADALQMRQLLQNLIGNGLKFRRIDEPPVVKVYGRFLPDRQQRQAGRTTEPEQCCLIVEDNGIGFDEKHQERIFGVFQRLHPRDVYEGTGIGLAICRRIAERHGGHITARSTPGSGSTFEVLLPLVQPKKTRA